jgi:hypothetical protein
VVIHEREPVWAQQLPNISETSREPCYRPPPVRNRICHHGTCRRTGAAGLALTGEAFHPTVLTLWRNKLRASAEPQRIVDAIRAVVAECGVLTGKTRRALDATVLDDAVARQDTITMLVTQIRRVRKLRVGVRVLARRPVGGTPKRGITFDL